MERIHQNQYRIAADLLAAFVDITDQIAGHAQTEALIEARVPPFFSHWLAGGLEPRDVSDIGAKNGPALKEFTSLQNRLGVPNRDHLAHEFEKIFLFIVELPLEPGEFVILTVGVVVALLRVA